ncbi:MAG: hypothetical protein GXY94_03625 [Bacteroidales bacterium]|nr:hypothetical protein [Bacteroidales bacterium]
MTQDLQNPQNTTGQTIVIYQMENKSNGAGVAGFVLALLGLIFSWIPVLNWILWILGLIFSIIGVTKKPKGLAIAGLIISFIAIIVLIAVVGAAFGALALMG